MSHEENHDNTDPFESLLSLEEQFQAEGYQLGYSDGSKAGRTEGRIFGLEKGYEKFLALGKLGGRATVWKARLPSSQTTNDEIPKDETVTGSDTSGKAIEDSRIRLPPISGSERLRKHLDRLDELTTFSNIDTANSEEGVADTDERIKGAGAKGVLIARIAGEGEGGNGGERRAGGMRKAGPRSPGTSGGAAKGTSEMEDFGGLPRALKR